MPRPKKLIPSYLKHRASGLAVVTINGHDHYLGPHGTKASHLEYDRLITEWVASGRSTAYGASAQSNSETVVALAIDYVQHAKEYHGPAASSEYHRILPVLKLLRDLYGRTAAPEFGPLQLKSLRQKFLGLGWCRTNINANIKRVVRMFRWAAAEGRVSPVIPQALAMVPGLRRGKTTARESAPVLPIDDATVDATITKLPTVVADMVRFQRLTGCRPGEVCALRPIDVDRSGDVWVYRPLAHKTAHHGHARTILIGPKAQAVLPRYLARDAEAFCFRPCDSEAKRRAAMTAARTTPLSCGNKVGSNRKAKPRRLAGESYNARSYHRAVRQACLKLELTPWGPNRLRHSAATDIRREFGLEAAQVVLGHASANITQVYAERDLAKGIEVARAIG